MADTDRLTREWVEQERDYWRNQASENHPLHRGMRLRAALCDAWLASARSEIGATTLAPSSATGDMVPMWKKWIEDARCPECDGSGYNAHQVGHGEWEQVQCQWCDERAHAIAAMDRTGA